MGFDSDQLSDEVLGTFVPILIYWVYSGFYFLLGLFFEKYRLHPKKDEHEKNLVPKGTVIKGVIIQQLLQAIVATLCFMVKFIINSFILL